jgi:hypothetical protein
MSTASRDRGYVLTYELDGNLLVVQKIGALENDTKRTLADLLSNSIVYTDDI